MKEQSEPLHDQERQKVEKLLNAINSWMDQEVTKKSDLINSLIIYFIVLRREGVLSKSELKTITSFVERNIHAIEEEEKSLSKEATAPFKPI